MGFYLGPTAVSNIYYGSTALGNKYLGTNPIQGGSGWPSLYLGPVANRITFPNEGMGNTNLQIMTQTHHVMMDTAANYLRVRYPNYFPLTGGGAGEQNTGGAATGRCSVYWYNPSTGAMVVTQMLQLSDNNATASAVDGGIFDFIAQVSPPEGSHMWLRFWGSRSAGQWAYAHGQADYANGDILRYGATTTDYTNTTTAFSDSYQGALDRFGPCNILSYTMKPTLEDWGDSIGAGLKAVPSGLFGNNGTGQKFFADRMAGVNCSVPGELSASLADPVKTAKRRVEANFCSHVLIEIGSNSAIANNIDAPTVMADVQTLRAARNKPAIIGTIPPWTDNAGGGNTIGNKRAADSNAVAFNILARAIPTGFATVWDRASALEDVNRVWSNLAYPSSDWIHPLTAGEVAIKTSLSGFDFTKVGNPTLVNAGFEYVSGTLYQSLGFTTGWTAQQATMTNNNIYSPEHKVTATLIKEDATAATNHRIFSQQTLTLASTTKKITCFVKRVVGSRNVQLQVQQNGGSFLVSATSVNLGTGAQIFVNNSAGTVSGFVSTLVDGYWKIEFNVAFSAGHPTSSFLYVSMADAAGSDSYTGDNTSSIAAWGFDIR